MVSKKDIKGLDFNTIEEYFDYILDSKINGNRSQAISLFTKLSSKQKLTFYGYISNTYDANKLVEVLDYVNTH
jgi:hypothetical protein